MNAEAEIKRLFDEGYKSKTIAQMLGLSEGTVNRHTAAMTKPAVQEPNRVYGLTDVSLPVRMSLATLLGDLRVNQSARDIARLVGINQRQQRKALSRPYEYDWTFSQVDRLLAHFNLTWKDLM